MLSIDKRVMECKCFITGGLRFVPNGNTFGMVGRFEVDYIERIPWSFCPIKSHKKKGKVWKK